MIKSVAVSSGSAWHAPAGQELPSHQVLAALVTSLRGELARAQQRTAGLEDQLRAASRNSSRPPSGDGLARS
jgi:transposase